MTTSARGVSGRAATRQAIVTVATRCFEESGFSGTAMDDIAAAAGVSRQTLYNHFDSKPTLITEVLAHRAATIVDQLRSEVAFRAPTLELIADTAYRHLELSLEDPIGRRLTAPEDSHLISRSLVDERMVAVRRSFWVPLLRAAVDQGFVRGDVDVEDTVTWLFFVLFSLGSTGADFGLTGERLRAALRNYLTSGIGGR
jgi:TetR/AcrR family transcriptional regulator of autoinduction and epiphytic fitness